MDIAVLGTTPKPSGEITAHSPHENQVESPEKRIYLKDPEPQNRENGMKILERGGGVDVN